MIRQHEPPKNGASPERSPPIVIEVITDPEEVARARARWEQSDRNIAWWQANAPALFGQLRGKHVVVAGQELFVADTAREARALADAAHPGDDGKFHHYVPKEKVDRIYAHRRAVVRL